jgi:hypothetical protein
MKNFAHVYEGKVVNTYQANKPQTYGGPWAEGESFEVDSSMNLLFVEFKGYDKEGLPVFKEKKIDSNLDFKQQRKLEYPDIMDFISAQADGDQAAMDKFLADVKAVNKKYPKPKA